MPDITIGPGQGEQASDNFNTAIWTGNNANNRAIAVGFQPDFSWTQTRTQYGNGSELFDSVRGAGKSLKSETTAAEVTNKSSGYIGAFTSTGFTTADGSSSNSSINYNDGGGQSYVAWNWKAGGTASSNSDGSITSSVSANTGAGFSIVSWTGTGSNATVGHGLGVAPSLIINKPRAIADNWISWAAKLGTTGYIYLNLNNAAATGAAVWNSTVPTTSVFSVGTSSNANPSSGTMISYCFANIEGYSKVGSYTGNGNNDGPFVFTGFRPAFILVKDTSVGNGWRIADNKRPADFNVINESLSPSSAATASTSDGDRIDFLSNGFKCRSSAGQYNDNNSVYIYLAFAEQPFKFSNAR